MKDFSTSETMPKQLPRATYQKEARLICLDVNVAHNASHCSVERCSERNHAEASWVAIHLAHPHVLSPIQARFGWVFGAQALGSHSGRYLRHKLGRHWIAPWQGQSALSRLRHQTLGIDGDGGLT